MSKSKRGAFSCASGNELPLLIKVPQAAMLLGLSISSIDRLVARGEIKPIVKLRHRLIPRSEIERFIGSNLGNV
jgi:excisionase family DNA binding protein